MTFIARSITPRLQRLVRNFRSVVLTGPRQSGKTTLTRHLFEPSHSYVSLEYPARRMEAINDPEAFLALHPAPLIIDEIQYAPELIAYIKLKIDQDPDSKGQYILTGSQNLLLAQELTQVLSGRAIFVNLWPFSRQELAGSPQITLPWQRDITAKTNTAKSYIALWQQLICGGYPELTNLPVADHAEWFESYVHTYLERDVRQIRQIGVFAQFQAFLIQIALHSGQLLNLTSLSRKVGVSLNTAKAWLSVLEATYQVILLRPYFSNISKRLVKSPRVYITDTGLLCHLLGIHSARQAISSPFAGVILESAVAMELTKALANHGSLDRTWFWRTSDGLEIDFIVETPQGLIPIEVKSSATSRRSMSRSIRRLRKLLPDQIKPGYVIYAGSTLGPLGDGDTALPLALL